MEVITDNQIFKTLFSEATFQFLEKFIYVVLIAVIAKITIFFVKKFLHKVISPKSLGERKASAIVTILTNIVRYTIYFCVIYSVLNIMFGTTMQSILAIAGVAGVSIGFGAQSLVKDFISGFFIMLEDQFAVDDIVSIDGKTGVVEQIGVRTTRIRSFDGDIHIIPNGEIKTVTNKSHNFSRAIIDVNISYKENLEKVLKILNNEMEKFAENEQSLLSAPVVLGVTDLGESAVTIKIAVQCAVKENFRIEREMRKLVKDRFDKENIQAPFTQVRVHTEN